MAVTLAVTGFAGCGGSTEKKSEEKETAKADAPTEPFGDTIKYDPSVEINDGKISQLNYGSGEVTTFSRKLLTDIQQFIRMFQLSWLTIHGKITGQNSRWHWTEKMGRRFSTFITVIMKTL